MPYEFDHATVCPSCPWGTCIEDRRVNRVRGRQTEFRVRQSIAMGCTFENFVPGSDNDPEPGRTFDEYLTQFRGNAMKAGAVLFGAPFAVSGSAFAKVEGDVFELMEAAALWNALSVWNRFMDTGRWDSRVFTQPDGAVPTPSRKAAALKLPRGYNPTALFKPEVRARIEAHNEALRLRGMELGLSSPDIVGIRLPDPLPAGLEIFLNPLDDMGDANRATLEGAYQSLVGTLDARAFLFAIAVKRTTRSDRLYQPLFEANVLKYLVEEVLRGAAFRFYVHMGSMEGADVEGRYNAASLLSLIRGGEPTRAVDRIYRAVKPVETVQTILNDLRLFPL